MSKFRRNQATPSSTPSPYGTEATNKVAMQRPSFSKALLEGAAIEDLPSSKASDLEKVLNLIDREYGSHTLCEYLFLNDGRVCGTLPQDEFFGANPGHFQMRLSWPEIIDGRLSGKLSINYRVESNFCNTVLEPGGGSGDPSGWTNLNTASIFVDEAIAKGFFAEVAILDILKFCKDKCGQQERATLTLTPQSEVYMQLRHTIVPVKPRMGGRKIVTKKQAGDIAGLGIANIQFSGATVLPRLSPLMGGKETEALSYQDLMAKYGVSAPVAQWGQEQTEPAIISIISEV